MSFVAIKAVDLSQFTISIEIDMCLAYPADDSILAPQAICITTTPYTEQLESDLDLKAGFPIHYTTAATSSPILGHEHRSIGFSRRNSGYES